MAVSMQQFHFVTFWFILILLTGHISSRFWMIESIPCCFTHWLSVSSSSLSGVSQAQVVYPTPQLYRSTLQTQSLIWCGTNFTIAICCMWQHQPSWQCTLQWWWQVKHPRMNTEEHALQYVVFTITTTLGLWVIYLLSKIALPPNTSVWFHSSMSLLLMRNDWMALHWFKSKTSGYWWSHPITPNKKELCQQYLIYAWKICDKIINKSSSVMVRWQSFAWSCLDD